MLLTDPKVQNVSIGLLIYGAVHGTWWLIRTIGPKRIRRGVNAVLADADEKNNESDDSMITMMSRLLKHQENLIQAVSNERSTHLDRMGEQAKEARDERTRQWDKIEQLTQISHELASGLSSAVTQFQHMHQELGRTVGRIEASQVNLATWIYQTMGAAARQPSWPPQQQPWPPPGHPPAQGRG